MYVSTRFCTLNIICMAFYECDYQLIPETHSIHYTFVCVRVCARRLSNSPDSLCCSVTIAFALDVFSIYSIALLCTHRICMYE